MNTGLWVLGKHPTNELYLQTSVKFWSRGSPNCWDWSWIYSELQANTEHVILLPQLPKKGHYNLCYHIQQLFVFLIIKFSIMFIPWSTVCSVFPSLCKLLFPETSRIVSDPFSFLFSHDFMYTQQFNYTAKECLYQMVCGTCLSRGSNAVSSQYDQTYQTGCFPAAAHLPWLLIHQVHSLHTSLGPYIQSYIQQPTLKCSTLPSQHSKSSESPTFFVKPSL